MPQEYVQRQSIEGFRSISSMLSFFDDFEGDSPWSTAGTGAGWISAPASVSKSSGFFSWRLRTRVTGATTGDFVRMTTRPPLLPSLRFRFGVDFMSPVVAGIAFITFQFTPRTLTRTHDLRIRYDRANNIWRALQAGGSYVNIIGSDYELVNDSWTRMNFVVDIENEIYEEIVFNGVLVNTGFPTTYDGAANATNRQEMFISIEVEMVGPDEVTVYIDNLFIEMP